MDPIPIIIKLQKSLVYSLQGLSYIARHELSFQLELVYSIASLIGIYFSPFTAGQKALLITTLILLLVSEIFNTAIELIVDRLSPEQSDFARHTKDLGSTAVFLILLASILQWIIFSYPFIVD